MIVRLLQTIRADINLIAAVWTVGTCLHVSACCTLGPEMPGASPLLPPTCSCHVTRPRNQQTCRRCLTRKWRVQYSKPSPTFWIITIYCEAQSLLFRFWYYYNHLNKHSNFCLHFKLWQVLISYKKCLYRVLYYPFHTLLTCLATVLVLGAGCAIRRIYGPLCWPVMAFVAYYGV